MDVLIVKDATPQAQLVNGRADIAYTLLVKNRGPNQAHNVVVADAAPSGVTFLAVTTQPAGGSCSVTAALLSCNLGTLGLGVERTIGLSARVTQTGTYDNCATVTGQGGDQVEPGDTDKEPVDATHDDEQQGEGVEVAHARPPSCYVPWRSCFVQGLYRQ